MRYFFEERSNGSVEINDADDNFAPVLVMAYYPDGRHIATAQKIVELLNKDAAKKI
jgi:hypothetical protein